MRWFLVVVIAAACTKPDPNPDAPLTDNPIDTIDPRLGFVADAWTSTNDALEAGRRVQVSEPDRILLLSDPLGVARLAAELERERAYCKTPPCAIAADVDAAVTSYAQKSTQYTPVLVAHYEALSAWVALAAAHQALALANVLDQAGTLTEIGRAEIRQAANGLTSAGAMATSFTTLDWKLVSAATTADPRINEEIVAHAPLIVPMPAIETAAVATVAAVLAEVDRETDPQATGKVAPLAPLCCSETMKAPLIGSPAYQALRRLALLREWTARADATQTIESYRSALATLAAKTLSAAPSDTTWMLFQADTTSYASLLATAVVVIDAAAIVMDQELAHLNPAVAYVDPNASHYRPNLANVGPGLEYLAPSIVLRAGTAIPVAAADEMYTPDYIPRLDQALQIGSSDGATQWAPAGPGTIEWDLRTAAPIDHVDVRIGRYGQDPPFIHYIERPIAGTFPTRTVFQPLSMDPEAPEVLPVLPVFVTYVVTAVAVDVLGRTSRVATVQIPFRFQEPHDGSARYSLFMEPGEPARATVGLDFNEPDFSARGLPPEQLTIRRYAAGTGTAIRFEPGTVTMQSSTGSLTVFNLDTEDRHLRAVYTAPYLVNPVGISPAIGGVAPLDLGLIPAGASAVIALPAGAIGRTTWTLYDPSIVAARPQRFRVAVRAP